MGYLMPVKGIPEKKFNTNALPKTLRYIVLELQTWICVKGFWNILLSKEGFKILPSEFPAFFVKTKLGIS